MDSVTRFLMLAVSVYALSGCGAGDSQVTDDDDFFVPTIEGPVSDDVFDRSRLLQVYIKMPAADFAILRSESRSLADTFKNCPDPDFDYTEFKATVNIDGEQLNNVEIRKKGYLGSVSHARPSIKLNFDTFEEGRTYKTLKRMTLNNDRQDPSHIHQCLAYDLYNAAGVKTPRCNLAHVVINGEDMGVYTHVESIKKPFLENNFLSKGGNLYEAQVADFGEFLNDRFELKTNKTANDRSDLTEVSDLLAMDDADFVANIGNVIALDEFISLWAVDTLIGNWDSASGNVNNYYIYHDSDDLFHFIPWGTDAAFTSVNPFKANSGPLYRSQSLAWRLFEIEVTREQYFARINELLASHWDEVQLLDDIQTTANLAQVNSQTLHNIRIFIEGDSDSNIDSQRTQLLAAMADTVQTQTDYRLVDQVSDCDDAQISTSLTAQFESHASGDQGSFNFTDINGNTINANMSLVSFSGVDSLVHLVDTSTLPPVVNLTLIGVGAAPSYQPYALQVFIEQPEYRAGSVSLHGIVSNVMLFKAFTDKTIAPILLGVGDSGTINLQLTGDGTATDPIKGNINVNLVLGENW